jgi:hypothetical protein
VSFFKVMAMDSITSKTDLVNRRNFLRRLASSKIKVICRKGNLDMGPNLAKAVLDISESGVRLVLKAPIEVGQYVSVSLEGVLHMRPIVCTGKVVWTAELAEGGYCVGVRLEKYLTYKDIRLLT